MVTKVIIVRIIIRDKMVAMIEMVIMDRRDMRDRRDRTDIKT